MAENTPRIPTPNDFMTAWKQFADQAEQQWNSFFGQLMDTEMFANFMGKYLDQSTTLQRTFGEYAEKYFQAMHVPTRSDITALSERLAAIESQLSILTAEQQRLAHRLEQPSERAAKQASS